MGIASNCKYPMFFGRNLNSITCKGLALIMIALFLRVVLLPSFSGHGGIDKNNLDLIHSRSLSLDSDNGIRKDKFLEVPQIEIDRLQPISFDKVFQFDKFNALCNGFVQLGRYSDLRNRTGVYELQKGSGRKWTVERDLDQLKEFSEDSFDGYEVIRIVGKNPFLWHDHWPVKDYARVFRMPDFG
ncbi:O-FUCOSYLTRANSFERASE 23 [Salix viminalis]|uniref:O-FUCOSYLTRANSFERASE 23 n=1 Tax=Salix viminalis TaxID=40686 RepID=A0A9Q0NUR4_SALVM|nr:O-FUCOSYLTRANSFERASE 23 [Salix viminalis]